MALEIELKFLIEGGGLPMLDSLPVIGKRLRRAPRKHIETTYFDTPEGLFAGNGLLLRVRKQAKARLLSVKQARPTGIARGEWESAIAGDRPSRAELETTPAGAVLAGNGSESDLAPLYTVAVDRASFLVKHGSAEIEVAVDRGEIKHQDKQLPICELELELKKGEPRQLFALARRFLDKAPLRLSFISKGDRGSRLAEGSWGTPVAASVPKLKAEMTAAEAFRTICHSCLYDFMLNESAITDDGDIEGVHRARIAIRRLRAALSLFKPVIADGELDHHRRELAWLSDLLGAARDLDVLQCRTFEPPADAGSAPMGTSALLAEVAHRRGVARAALREALDSERMRKLLLDLAHWLDFGDWRDAGEAGGGEPVLSRAPKLLARQYKRLHKRGRHLAEADPEQRHRIRITAKKLRYMSEFFDSLVTGGKRRHRFRRHTRALETIQNALGDIHDGEARGAFLETLVAEVAASGSANRAAVTAYAAGVFTASEQPKQKKLVRKARKALDRLAGNRRFLKAG
ncbi:MAG: CHAD domain-containing protein [Pseudomonadota bacterium]